MRHHTKDKADIAVLKVMADMAGKGYSIFVAISEHLPFDLIAYDGSRMIRVQVKYRDEPANAPGRAKLDIRRRWSDSKGSYSQDADKSEVELYALYAPKTDRCYYIWADEFGQRLTIHLDSLDYQLAPLV